MAPTYLWGTYNALNDTFGLITYQEQVAQIAREVGGFSLGEGVKLVKFISKKKTEKIQAMREKFLKGAKENGCPIEDAIAIWQQIEACGSYLFNKSHATAYAVTSYIGAFLKAQYPTAFYTVALEWADDKELIPIMSEMEACSNAKVVSPDINKSAMSFYTDYETNQIFWSLSRIKMVGTKAVDWIINERNKMVSLPVLTTSLSAYSSINSKNINTGMIQIMKMRYNDAQSMPVMSSILSLLDALTR